jgi:hypothetical protein
MPINPIRPVAQLGPRNWIDKIRDTITAPEQVLTKSPRPHEAAEKAEIAKHDLIALVVAGVNYPRKIQSSKLPTERSDRTYFKMSLNYKDYLLSNGVVSRVFVFDFLKGQCLSFRKGGGKAGDLELPPRDPLVVKNYRFVVGSDWPEDEQWLKAPAPKNPDRILNYYVGVSGFAKWQTGEPDGDVLYVDYKKGGGPPENSMNITDVYDTIRGRRGLTKITKSVITAGSIREVHFIGHAVHNGPVIVNTLRWSLQPKYYDKDGRSKDFASYHVFKEPDELPFFQSAFTNDAFLTIWGCDFNWEYFRLIKEAIAKKRKRQSIAEEVDTLKAYMASGYAAKLAKICRRPVYAALPGTESVHEDEPKWAGNFQPKVMHVNMEPRFKECLHFYKDHLGISFATTEAFKGDPTFGRGYAVYNP